jgi:hypothetical protein
MEILLLIVCFLPMAAFGIMLGREMDKYSEIQRECLKIQKEANRDWDIRIKHARQLNERITEIFNQNK